MVRERGGIILSAGDEIANNVSNIVAWADMFNDFAYRILGRANIAAGLFGSCCVQLALCGLLVSLRVFPGGFKMINGVVGTYWMQGSCCPVSQNDVVLTEFVDD